MEKFTKNQTWKKHLPHPLHRHSECFYQKLILQREIPHDEDEKVYAEIVEYKNDGKKSYEMKIQIPEELSITGTTININSFLYNKLDFDVIEKHAKKIISKLICPISKNTKE